MEGTRTQMSADCLQRWQAQIEVSVGEMGAVILTLDPGEAKIWEKTWYFCLLLHQNDCKCAPNEKEVRSRLSSARSPGLHEFPGNGPPKIPLCFSGSQTELCTQPETHSLSPRCKCLPLLWECVCVYTCTCACMFNQTCGSNPSTSIPKLTHSKGNVCPCQSSLI